MQVLETKLSGCYIIENDVHHDSRGFFTEVYNKKNFDKLIGKKINFVQDNFSFSLKGVLRGLHFQRKFPQGKLVRVLKGNVLDVVVDIRKDSKTFGSYFSLELSDTNHLQLWIPKGFAHGFLTLSDCAYFEYKCTEFYYPDDECSIIWNDEDLNINWPKNIKIITSSQDNNAMTFKKYLKL
tara:strand:+ start:2758 stop:3300 length:543 start_codon:yes stop_codon:yes gene_type:complete